MKFWTLFFILCLELVSNAARSEEPRETKVLKTRIAAIEAPVDNMNYDKSFSLDEKVASDMANKSKDRSLVTKIRQDLLKDKSLSRSARSIQIIIVEKEIILKGPVSSDNEQSKILNIAKKNSTNHKIRNQIEVIRE